MARPSWYSRASVAMNFWVAMRVAAAKRRRTCCSLSAGQRDDVAHVADDRARRARDVDVGEREVHVDGQLPDELGLRQVNELAVHVETGFRRALIAVRVDAVAAHLDDELRGRRIGAADERKPTRGAPAMSSLATMRWRRSGGMAARSLSSAVTAALAAAMPTAVAAAFSTAFCFLFVFWPVRTVTWPTVCTWTWACVLVIFPAYSGRRLVRHPTAKSSRTHTAHRIVRELDFMSGAARVFARRAGGNRLATSPRLFFAPLAGAPLELRHRAAELTFAPAPRGGSLWAAPARACGSMSCSAGG